jgi:peptidoglycan/LPS O-acetylase OafA/YrhL
VPNKVRTGRWGFRAISKHFSGFEFFAPKQSPHPLIINTLRNISMDQRIKELDGIRGIAILLVICFHTFKRASYLSANPILHFFTKLTLIGWIGVDIFFVLSGFLITSILLKTREDRNYFKNFYARRILRISPLYYLILAIVVCYIVVMEPETSSATVKALPYFLLNLQNWLAIHGGFPTLYLQVTWSLAIEEQYYLFWPLLVYFLKKRTLIMASLGIILLSLVARLLEIWLDPQNAFYFMYYSTITRLDALVLGALIAILFIEPGIWKERLTRAAFPTLLVTTILISFVVFAPNSPVLYNDVWIRFIGYPIVAIAGGALLVTAITQDASSLIRRLLRNKVLIFFGKYSYALYLLHPLVAEFCLNVFWRTGFRGWYAYVSYLLVTFGISVLLALFSWNLLEKRMFALKKYFA